MLESEVNLLRHAKAYADSLIGDVTDKEFTRQPVSGMNHPAWILGHLAYALDRHATFVGGEQQLGDWKDLFGKGSVARADAEAYPTKDEILAAWGGAVDRMLAAVEAADEATLSGPNTGPLPDAFPTIGAFLGYSMTSHTATHLGQLSAWRRAMGRDAMY